MKTIAAKFILLSTFVLILFPTLSHAQNSISIGSVSATSFCAGDPLSVTITVTGTWGHSNAFTLQLSNISGTFDNGFTRLGSVIDTAPGTFTIITTIPPSSPFSSHYRFRVIGAYPYTVSADNGSDIMVGEMPSNFLMANPAGQSAIALNESIGLIFDFAANVPNHRDTGYQPMNMDDTVYFDFGSGASPATRAILSQHIQDPQGQMVTYSTGGWKTITLRSVGPGGCSVSDTFHTYVYDCTNPVVPHDAVIVSANTVFTNNDKSNMTFWVNPGVSLTLGDNTYDTIFAESGASIVGQNGGQTEDILYLKPGASSDPDFEGVVVYAPGASVTTTGGGDEIRTVECTGLTFDYAVAPPNSIMHINDAVMPAAPLPSIALSPNPTSGMITIAGLPSNIQSISVMNLLGNSVMNIAESNSSSLQFDISKLIPGTYYVRFAMPNAVITKKIIRE